MGGVAQRAGAAALTASGTVLVRWTWPKWPSELGFDWEKDWEQEGSMGKVIVPSGR